MTSIPKIKIKKGIVTTTTTTIFACELVSLVYFFVVLMQRSKSEEKDKGGAQFLCLTHLVQGRVLSIKAIRYIGFYSS